MLAYTRTMVYGMWILAVLVSSVVSLSCTRQEQNRCTSELDSYFTAKHNIYPNFDDATLLKVCSAATSAHQCLSRLHPCSNIDQRHHEGLKEAYTYICGQGEIVYKKNRECFTRPKLLREAAKCNSTYQEDLKDLAAKASYEDRKDLAEEQCRLSNIYLWCIRGEVKSECGGVAAQWHHKVNTLVLTPVLDDINCKIEEPFPLDKVQIVIIVVSIAVGVVFIIMIILTFIFCIQRKRAKDRLLQDNTDDQEGGEEDGDSKKDPLEFSKQVVDGVEGGKKSHKDVLASIPTPREMARVAPIGNGNNAVLPQQRGADFPGNEEGVKGKKGKEKKKKQKKDKKQHRNSSNTANQNQNLNPVQYPQSHQYSNPPTQYPQEQQQSQYPQTPHPQYPQYLQPQSSAQYPQQPNRQYPQPGYPQPQASAQHPQYLHPSSSAHPAPPRSSHGSLKSSLRSGDRTGRSSTGRSVTLDESTNRSLPEYDIQAQKY